MLEPKCSSIASKPSVQDTYPLHSSIILFLPPPHPPLTRSSRHTSLYNLSIHSLEALTFNPKQSQTDQLSLSHPMLLFCSVLFCLYQSPEAGSSLTQTQLSSRRTSHTTTPLSPRNRNFSSLSSTSKHLTEHDPYPIFPESL